MSVALHRQAERLMGEADIAMREGRPEAARLAWQQAADFEARCFRLIPPDRQRTRGVIAVSAVALLWKAGDHAQARALVTEYLLMGRLTQASHDELLAIVKEEAPQ